MPRPLTLTGITIHIDVKNVLVKMKNVENVKKNLDKMKKKR